MRDECRNKLEGGLAGGSKPRLIGFKLQSHFNDANRSRDLDDIRALLQATRSSLDMQEVRRYFALFDQESSRHDIVTALDY